MFSGHLSEPETSRTNNQLNSKLLVLSRHSSAKISDVYRTWWQFASERQSMFYQRIKGDHPCTRNPILGKYKFTNAYRASDRVSQYLIRNVIYSHNQANEEVVFRVLLFKLFNKIETWELLTEQLGIPTYRSWRIDDYDAVLSKAKSEGRAIYSAAYIMPAGTGDLAESAKHLSHLRLLDRMMKDSLPARLSEARSMREGFNLIRSYPMIGDFLAYQYITDINYSHVGNFSEQEFVIPGPGAKDGIKKCFESTGGLSETDVIRWMAENQDEEFKRMGIDFSDLWGRQLQLIDVQNIFCEVGKYARIAHPNVLGTSGRTKIKQLYRPNAQPLTPWYPPKWRINEKINLIGGKLL